MAIIDTAQPRVMPQGEEALSGVGHAVQTAAGATAGAGRALGEIGSGVQRFAMVIAEKQYREDETLGSIATANHKQAADLRQQSDFARGDLHLADPQTGETGYETAPAAYEQWLEETSAKAAEVLPARMQDRWLKKQRLLDIDLSGHYERGMIDRKYQHQAEQIYSTTEELASGRKILPGTELGPDGEPKFTQIPIDPRTAMQFAEANVNALPVEKQEPYLRQTRRWIVEGFINTDPDTALPVLEGFEGQIGLGEYATLHRQVESAQYMKGVRFEHATMEDVRLMVSGNPEKGTLPDYEGALTRLNDASDKVPEKNNQRRNFRWQGLRTITEGILSVNAEDAIDFMDLHKAEYDPAERRHLIDTAQTAIRKTGGSISAQHMEADSAAYLSLSGTDEDWVNTYNEISRTLTPQALGQHLRRREKRDAEVTEKPQKLGQLLSHIALQSGTTNKQPIREELGRARFGDVRKPEELILGENINLLDQSYLSKETYDTLQRLVTLNLPPSAGSVLGHGWSRLVEELAPTDGKWTEAQGKEILFGATVLADEMKQLTDTHQPLPTYQDLATRAAELASVVRGNYAEPPDRFKNKQQKTPPVKEVTEDSLRRKLGADHWDAMPLEDRELLMQAVRQGKDITELKKQLEGLD